MTQSDLEPVPHRFSPWPQGHRMAQQQLDIMHHAALFFATLVLPQCTNSLPLILNHWKRCSSSHLFPSYSLWGFHENTSNRKFGLKTVTGVIWVNILGQIKRVWPKRMSVIINRLFIHLVGLHSLYWSNTSRSFPPQYRSRSKHRLIGWLTVACFVCQWKHHPTAPMSGRPQTWQTSASDQPIY